MVAEIRKGNNAFIHHGANGGILAVFSFAPSYAAGFLIASRILVSESCEIAPFALTIMLCFAAWCVYLFYDLQRVNAGLGRILFWGSAVGLTLGYLGYAATL